MFTFSRPLYISLLAAAVCLLGACDSTEPEPVGPDPGPAMARLTLDLDNVTAIRDCDSGDNPGDFHFRIGAFDGRNQPIGETVEIPNGAYGSSGGQANTIQLDDGTSLPVREDITFSLPEQEGSAFTLALSMTEWDTATTADPGADDVTRNRTYDFRDGRFQNIAGTQRLSVSGSNSSLCRVELSYTITVE